MYFSLVFSNRFLKGMFQHAKVLGALKSQKSILPISSWVLLEKLYSMVLAIGFGAIAECYDFELKRRMNVTWDY